MKKLIVALVAGAFLGLLVAPVPAAADTQFGIKGGVNIAKLTGADLSELSNLKDRVGFVGGVFLAFNMGPVFTLQLEGLYTMKGISQDIDVEGTSYTDKLNAEYIEIPLLFKLRLPTPGISPFVFAGPSMGFKISEKVTFGGVEETENFFKNNDYGAIFGGGVNLGRHIQLDVRYSLGLAKIIKTVEGVDELDMKNGVWSATVGIAF